MLITKPTLVDVEQIKLIVDGAARNGEILPRTAEDIAERIREFVVSKDGNRITGISSLRIYYPYLAEIRSIVVQQEYRGMGIAKRLIDYELKEARSLGVRRVFALTFQKEFFEKLGFKLIDKKELPQKKIWEDCINCPLFPDCKEEALIIEIHQR